ncbi:helix-turn-helix domain-containing protein [Ulvibacterium marinum]|uniref:helix-turn-helix domain-containing protein n=1 Tax=Ulvibacterium marinum TaxID=2419782 RepID=UPI0024941913|nr:helix-turn-helix transcriptional regulator [Ulvibacterium marinum]
MTDNDKKRFYSAVGQSIKEARVTADIRQAELAKKINMSRASIVNIEKGRQHTPLHILWSLSEILEVEIGTLIPNFQSSNSEVKSIFDELIKKSSAKGHINEDSMENLNSFISQSS